MTDKPKTAEEIAALPVGPEIKREEISPGVFRPVMRETKVLWHEEHEVMGYMDDEGGMWRLGQYADGSYYRERLL